MPAIFLIFAFFIMTFVVGKVYTKKWAENLFVNLSFQDEPVFEGEKGYMKETIRNEKKLPIPILHVKFQTSKNIIFSKEDSAKISDLTYKNDLFALMPYQQIKRTLSFYCAKRGHYHISKAEVISSFLFFTGFLANSVSQDTSLYVYPRQLDIPELDVFLSQVTYSLKSKQRLFEDPFSFAGIREYQPFDPEKLINWNASAKVNNLMVNVREYSSGQPVIIMINLEPSVTWHMDMLLEESIRLAVSAAGRLLREGIPVALWTNYDTEGLMVPELSDRVMDDINKRMALLDLTKECEPYDKWLEKMVLPACKEEFTYILISHDDTSQMYLATENFAGLIKELWQIRPVIMGRDIKEHSSRIHSYERLVSLHEKGYGDIL